MCVYVCVYNYLSVKIVWSFYFFLNMKYHKSLYCRYVENKISN